MTIYSFNWPLTRCVAWLKRIAKSVEYQNAQRDKELVLLERLVSALCPPLRDSEPKPAEFAVATTDELNRAYRIGRGLDPDAESAEEIV